MATASAKRYMPRNLRQRVIKRPKSEKMSAALAAKLEGLQVKLATKVSSTGKIFGSINNIQVAEALASQGYEIDRRNITIVGEENVKEVGIYDAVVKCHRDIKANIKIEVVGEE